MVVCGGLRVRHGSGVQSEERRAQREGAACGGVCMPFCGAAAPQYKEIAASIISERLSTALHSALNGGYPKLTIRALTTYIFPMCRIGGQHFFFVRTKKKRCQRKKAPASLARPCSSSLQRAARNSLRSNSRAAFPLPLTCASPAGPAGLRMAGELNLFGAFCGMGELGYLGTSWGRSAECRAQREGAAFGGICMPLRGAALPQYKEIAASLISGGYPPL